MSFTTNTTSSSSYRPVRSSPLSQTIKLETSEPEDSFTTPKMSIIQTQFLARQARSKLAREAGRPGHRLRRLVGHANLLDILYQHLIEAEREQQRWFDNAILNNVREEEHESIGSLAVDDEDDYYDSSSSDSDSESESDYDYDDDVQMKSFASFNQSTHSLPSATKSREIASSETAVVEVTEVTEFDSDDDETDDEGLYPLTRSAPHHQPPALVDDFESSEDEDSHPPSPHLPTIESTRPIPPMQTGLWEKEERASASYFDDHSHPSLRLSEMSSDPLDSSLYSPLVDSY
ncbi:hypothetical protein BJ508DRAFT_320273 [Ascobolus immersus RN42]|uniref:Uncharacterized protein n=1 Tax=Ascobolus immersus RN42 TaxID=1160509 RepID=A0A3N4IPQ9_ASCIM|nr:hypothetical protein BJ508DRAFT_320273 [Ascobolus immersus RN42]